MESKEKKNFRSSSIKQMIIDEYIKNSGYSSLSKLKSKSNIPEITITDPGNILRSESAHSLNQFIPVSKRPVQKSRPSSVCSSKSTNLYTSQYFDANISVEFSTAIKNCTIKAVQNLQKTGKNENSLCLVFSLLMILAEIDDNIDFTPGVKILRSRVWQTFLSYISKPGLFVQIIKKLPKLIKDRKIPENDIKKAAGLFNMVSLNKITEFKIIYDLVKEALLYIKDCYGINILFKPPKDIQKKVNKYTFTDEKPVGKHRNASVQVQNFETSIVVNIFPKSTKNESKELSFSSEIFNPNNVEIIEPVLEQPSQQELLSRLLKQPISLFKPEIVPRKIRNKSKSNLKNQQFLIESRVNKRIHDKLIRFFDGKKTTEKIGDKQEIIEKLINEFIETLPCAEISASTLKFLEYFVTTKEFDHYIQKHIRLNII